MSIETDVRSLPLREILPLESSSASNAFALHIPEYQRPYEWTPELALQLFDDLAREVGPAGETPAKTWQDVLEKVIALDDDRPPYLIGSLILHASSGSLSSADSHPERPRHHDVVDGQQRLLTLLMLRKELLRRTTVTVPVVEDTDEPPPALLVRDALRAPPQLRNLTAEERIACWEVISHRTHMVVITTDDLDEAFSIFDSQNTRGLGLAPHDLLKARHLREMRGESAAKRIAAIERWEETDQEELRTLFARYLFRIARWSQGLHARSFTTGDIDLFRGISNAGRRSPAQQYHAAAQSMIPAIQQWEPSVPRSDGDAHERRMNHARFRLDSPVMAGSPFFEMVNFFLEELRRLRHDPHVVPMGDPTTDGGVALATEKAHPDSWEALFGTHRVAGEELTVRPHFSTMFYVSELYLAAMLYAVNCFGEEATTEAAPFLRRWAFHLRTVRHSVREDSIDNYSMGKDSVFPLMRRSSDLESALRHRVPLPQGADLPKLGRATGTLILREAGIDPLTVYPKDDRTT